MRVEAKGKSGKGVVGNSFAPAKTACKGPSRARSVCELKLARSCALSCGRPQSHRIAASAVQIQTFHHPSNVKA